MLVYFVYTSCVPVWPFYAIFNEILLIKERANILRSPKSGQEFLVAFGLPLVKEG